MIRKQQWLFLLLIFCTLPMLTFAQSQPSLWTSVEERQIPASGKRYITATEAQTYKLNIKALEQILAIAPMERTPVASATQTLLQLPMPDGSMETFDIVESPVMDPELAAKFPEINTYAGVGLNDPGKYVRFDLTPQGFHAMIMIAGESTVYIDPYTFGGDIEHYIVYDRAHFVPAVAKNFSCGVEAVKDKSPKTFTAPTIKSFGSCELRTYRLALSATGEYSAFHGGTLALAQAAQVTTMNRVNGMYERDMSIRMNIIGNNDLIVYTNAGSDPFTNGNTGAMINECQSNTDAVIGSGNYDIGHVFGTNSGGLAGLGVVCANGQKARGVTGSGAPVGDPFDIDYVAHEVGHQFDCNHTQNNNCNRNNATAWEPGSASTIMGYAGICAPNVQNNSDDHFHGGSLEEMGNFITSGGHNCPVTTPLSNTAPTITSASNGYTIPGSTPFQLTAVATDPDANTLTYCWEQMETNVATMPPVATTTAGPNFRSNSPTTDPTRYFPNLPDLLAGVNPTWEVLASVTRTYDFRCTVRDNAAGGGCNDHADVTINVDGNSGPFVVTYPSATGITWAGATTETVTWSVAGTAAAPVSCANVDILISTDGGTTFSVLLANTPNDGSQLINVPNTATTTARIKIVCSDNIFFDISDNNFTITAATFDYLLTVNNPSVGVCPPTDATFNIDIGSIGGYNDPVNLVVTGVPAGGIASFSTNPVVPVGSSILTISNTAGIAPGTYAMSLDASSTSGNKSQALTLFISDPTPGAVTLSTPVNGAPAVGTPTTFTWVATGGAGVTYDIDIATDPGFASIVDNATGLSATNYVSSALSNTTTYYWRVRATNACGTGPYSTTFSFTTNACITYMSTDIPVAISATGTPTITSTLNIPTPGTITDVNVVGLTGDHTWINDLTVTLTSPATTPVILWSQICNNEDDFDLNFDDAAAPGALPCPPTGGGTYQPQGSLASYNGEDPSGTWTLTINDAANQDGGNLLTWGLLVCASPLPTDDAGISAIINPTTIPFCDNPFIPEVTLENFGTDPLTSVTINYQIDAGPVMTFNWTGNLASGNTINVLLPSTSGPAGAFTFTAYTSNPNGNADPEPANDASSVNTSILGAQPIPYSEPFEAGAMPSDITVVNPDADAFVWVHTTSASAYGTGTGSALFDNYSGAGGAGNNPGGTYDWMVLPSLDFTGNTGTSMRFDYAYAQYDASFNDSLYVRISTDCGLTYVDVYGDGEASLATAPDNTAQFVPTGTEWDSVVIDLTAYDNMANVSIAFVNASGWGNQLFIDNINVTSAAACGMTASITGTTDATCSYSTDGTATVSATGGTPGYTYLWDAAAAGQTTATATGLAAGSYSVTVFDVGSCSAITTANVAGPTAVSGSVTGQTDVDCFGNSSGSVTVAGSGGSGVGYTYDIGSGAQGSGTFTGLAANSYTVTVSDGNGCTGTVAATITEPAAALAATIGSQTDVDCFGNSSGSVTVSATGGTTAYSYDIGAGNQPTSTFSGLAANSYTITVTDNNGCSTTVGATITQPSAALAASVGSQTDVDCFGNSSGAVTVNATGGTTAYTYDIGSGAQGSGTFTGLAANSYTVTVTDNNGCMTTTGVTITQPAAALSSSMSSTGESCATNDGTADATPTGGTSPYSFVWSGAQTSGSITGLSAGTYQVTITDNNGCTTSNSVIVSDDCNPCSMVATATTTDPSCNGACDGSIVISQTGGTPTIVYAWSTGGNTDTESGLCAGTYTVTVTDNVGCADTLSVTLNNPAIMTVSVTGNDPLCFGVDDGDATATPTNGTAPYSFVWSGGETDASITGLAAGTHDVTVTDNNGCTATGSVTLNSAAFFSVSLSHTNPTSSNNGSIDATATGGTAPYSYDWSSGETTEDLSAIGAGSYTVTVTDANGCTTTATANLIFVGIEQVEIAQAFDVMPNPNNGQFVVNIEFNTLQNANVRIINVLGQTLREYNFNEQSISIPIDVVEQAGGIYFVALQTESGMMTKKVTVAK